MFYFSDTFSPLGKNECICLKWLLTIPYGNIKGTMWFFFLFVLKIIWAIKFVRSKLYISKRHLPGGDYYRYWHCLICSSAMAVLVFQLGAVCSWKKPLVFSEQSRINSKSFVHSICVGVRRSHGFENQSLQKEIGVKLRRNLCEQQLVAVRRTGLPSQRWSYTGCQSFKGIDHFPILAFTATTFWKSIYSLSLSLPDSGSVLKKSGRIL